MKASTALVIAIVDSLAMFITIAYGASLTRVADKDTVLFSLFFYLTVVMVVLCKLSVWTWVISKSIGEERAEREQTDYIYRYRDGLVITDMDRK